MPSRAQPFPSSRCEHDQTDNDVDGMEAGHQEVIRREQVAIQIFRRMDVPGEPASSGHLRYSAAINV
jgi:hypothetical protein